MTAFLSLFSNFYLRKITVKLVDFREQDGDQLATGWKETANIQRRRPLLPTVNITRNSLSSPRAESARAVTGRRCPHSGNGDDFLTGQPYFFSETAVTPERRVEKSSPRSEINRHAEG